jgi:putative radical SAM enzyme (TIGR03279 family)
MVKVVSNTYEEFGIGKGDDLVSINGNLINDLIDYRFHAADEELRLRVQKPDGLTAVVEYDTREYGPLELELESDPIKRCKNKCVFCFIHQLPRGLRKSLYVKDEDYRLSFIHGNYITLTNLSEEDFKRIIDMHMSPLYISVHTTDEDLRRRMLGKKKIDPLMPQINRLIRAGIELHTQVVVCPGLNDGNHLIKTVANLAIFHPNLASVAIVPVGLTRHRQKLPKLKKVTAKDAAEILRLCDLLQKRYMDELGSRFLFPADEFFLMARRKIPPRKYYEDFPQIENGVGMIRNLMSSRKLPKMKLKKKVKATVVTGALMADMLLSILTEKLKDVKNLKFNILPVENKLMGKSVNVSGLLGGKDIYTALKKEGDLGDIIFLPPNCLNDDDLFLDDWTMSMIEKKLKLPLVGGCYSAYNTFMPVLRRSI